MLRERELSWRSEDTLAALWTERHAQSLKLAGWSAEVGDGNVDGALLPLSLRGGEVLLTGGLRSGAAGLYEVLWADTDSDSEEESLQAPPKLVWSGSDLSRRSQVRAACAVAQPEGAASAQACVAWLGGEGVAAVLSVCDVRHKRRTGAARIKELGTCVMRCSLWAVACSGQVALAGTSEGVASIDVETLHVHHLLRHPGSDVMAVADGLCGLRNGKVLAVDGRAGTSRLMTRLASAVTSLSVDAHGFVACGVDGTLGLWDVRSGALVSRYEGHVNNASLLLRHTTLGEGVVAAPGADGVLRMWSRRGKRLTAGCEAGGGIVYSAVAPGEHEGRLVMWAGGHEGLGLCVGGWKARLGVMQRWAPA